jgi:hypothetical protein
VTIVLIQLGFVLATAAAFTLFLIDLHTWRVEAAKNARAPKAGLRAFVRALGALGTGLGGLSLSAYVQAGAAGYWPSAVVGLVVLVGFGVYYVSFRRLRARP